MNWRTQSESGTLAGMGASQELDALLGDAIRSGVAPGCVSAVWRGGVKRWHKAHGVLATHAGSPCQGEPVDRHTLYDLASLTKVLATSMLVAHALDEGELTLDDEVPESLAVGGVRPTLRDLLEHSAGLEAHREFFAPPWSLAPCAREGLISALRTVPPGLPPRTRAIYSDLGFLVLGAWLEKLGGARLDRLFEQKITGRLYLTDEIGFRPLLGGEPIAKLERIAPTEVYDPKLHTEGEPSYFAIRRRLGQEVCHGIVHDDNCVVMGGVAGHAGLFGTAGGVLAIGREWLNRLTRFGNESWAVFARRSTVEGSTRRLGFDSPDPDGGGSTGGVLSESALGHLGFSGTSLWIDPEREGIYVLLTNRVHPTRSNEGIRELRAAFHRLAVQL